MIAPNAINNHVKGQERYRQLRRVLGLSEILRQYRFGCSVDFLNHELAERTGESWHKRTTYRDVKFLESCGMVQPRTEGEAIIWHWREAKPLTSQPPEKIR